MQIQQLQLPFPRAAPIAFPTTPTSAAQVCLRRRPVSATMYEVLEVAETAGREEIKAAYKREARRWHPDTCRSPEEKERFAERFMRAKEAYLVLSDPAARLHYDLSQPTGAGLLRVRRKAAGRSSGGGFGDWRSQLDALKRRSDWKQQGMASSLYSSSSSSSWSSWGSRIRRGDFGNQEEG